MGNKLFIFSLTFAMFMVDAQGQTPDKDETHFRKAKESLAKKRKKKSRLKKLKKLRKKQKSQAKKYEIPRPLGAQIAYAKGSWLYEEFDLDGEKLIEFNAESTKEISTQSRFFFLDPIHLNIDYWYTWGSMDYEGGELFGDKPISYDDDSFFSHQVEFKMSYYYSAKRFSLSPLFGFGYYFARDEEKPNYNDPAIRDYYYNYLPIGLKVRYLIAPKFILEFEGTYRYYISGQNNTIYVGENLTFDMDNGKGYRYQIGLQFRHASIALTLSYFYDYWDIKRSNFVDSEKRPNTFFYEPDNTTVKKGFMLSLGF